MSFQWLCVPFLLLNSSSLNIVHTAFNHTFQEPWLGSLEKDMVWRWIDDFLMLVMLALTVSIAGFDSLQFLFDSLTSFPQGLGSLSFQCFHQRTLSASSSRTAQLTCFAAACMIAILGIPPVLVGAVAASTGGKNRHVNTFD